MVFKKEDILEQNNMHLRESPMTHCKNCGTELTENAKFCPKCGTPVVAEDAAARAEPVAPESASGLKLAFWGERFLAWLIDSVIIGVIVGFLTLFTWFAGHSFTLWSSWPSWIPFFNFNMGGIIYFLYWMLMDGAYGQSLGKMIMHLKVTRIDGEPANIGQVAVESAGKAFFLPLDFLIGLFLYPKRRQRVFSYLSETVVVRE